MYRSGLATPFRVETEKPQTSEASNDFLTSVFSDEFCDLGKPLLFRGVHFSTFKRGNLAGSSSGLSFTCYIPYF